MGDGQHYYTLDLLFVQNLFSKIKASGKREHLENVQTLYCLLLRQGASMLSICAAEQVRILKSLCFLPGEVGCGVQGGLDWLCSLGIRGQHQPATRQEVFFSTMELTSQPVRQQQNASITKQSTALAQGSTEHFSKGAGGGSGLWVTLVSPAVSSRISCLIWHAVSPRHKTTDGILWTNWTWSIPKCFRGRPEL